MRGTKMRGWVCGAAFGALPVAVLALEWPRGLELRFTPRGGGTPVVAVPIAVGERFTLRYNHSVDRAPIWEVHSVGRGGCIYVEEERCVMFGAGMGHWPGRGRLTARGGHQVIEGLHEPVGEFVLRVGRVGVDHTLIWRGREFNLSRLAAGDALTVSVRPVGLWQRLGRNVRHGL